MHRLLLEISLCGRCVRGSLRGRDRGGVLGLPFCRLRGFAVVLLWRGLRGLCSSLVLRGH
jgi:hypothetical protein